MSRPGKGLALAVKPMSLRDRGDEAANPGSRRRIAREIRVLACPEVAHRGGTRGRVNVE
jgi:hypothetical protein